MLADVGYPKNGSVIFLFQCCCKKALLITFINSSDSSFYFLFLFVIRLI